MSGILSFTVTPANQALTFSWSIDSGLITTSNISTITLILNDFDTKAMEQYPITPVVVTDQYTGVITGVTTTATITTFHNEPLVNGQFYGAGIVVTLKNGVSHSKDLATFTKPVTIPNKPQLTVGSAEGKILIQINNYNPGQDNTTGYDELLNIFVYLSDNTNKVFKLLKFPASDFGSNFKDTKVLEHGVNGLTILNGNQYEIAVTGANSQGQSPVSNTFLITPSDLPGLIVKKKALPTIVYNETSEQSATILFGNTLDAVILSSTKPILNYKVYRYNVDACLNAIPASQVLISTVITDASGFSFTPDVTYNLVNYPFYVVDPSVVLGTQYIYGITATNINGEGDESFTDVMLAGMLADAPTLTLTPENEDVLASAVQPVNMGGFTPKTTVPDASGNFDYFFRYTWSYFDASGIKQQVAQIVTSDKPVSSEETLVNGTIYTVEAQAITVYENVEYFGVAATVTSVPYGKPPAPTGLALQTFDINGPLNGAINASWNAVTDKNGSTGNLTYSILVADASGIYQVFAFGITDTTFQLTNLTNGEVYNIKVRADVFNTEINDEINGFESAAEIAVPFKLPDNATNLTLTHPSLTSLALAFDINVPSMVLGTGAVRAKVIIYDLDNDNNITSPVEVLLDSYPMNYTFTGLTTTARYEIHVYTGVEQDSIIYYNTTYEIIQGSVFGDLGVPLNINVVPLNQGIRLIWDAPAEALGITLQGYKIYLDGQLYATTGLQPEYYIIDGLVNTTQYTIEMKSYGSAFGETNGVESDFSTTFYITPNEAPDKPNNLEALPASTQVTLTWDRDTKLTPGTLGYRVTIDDNLVSEQDLTVGSGTNGAWSWTETTVTYLATGLTDDVTYLFKVSSYTASDIYSPDANINATPSNGPSAPASLISTPGDVTINSSWTAPLNTSAAGMNGNGPLLYKYMIDASYSDNDGNPVTTNITTQMGLEDTFFNLSGSSLENGGRYIVSVFAYYIGSDNNIFISPATTLAVIVKPSPQDVSNLTVVPNSNQNVLTWVNPTDTEFYTRDAVLVYVKLNGGTEILVATASANTTTYTHTGLLNGGSYVYRVVSQHTDNTRNQVDGVTSNASIPFGKAFLENVNPNSAGNSIYTLTINKNGSNLQDYVAVGALPDNNGNISIPVLQGTVSNNVSYYGSATATTDANQKYDLQLNMGVNVNAIMVIFENAAGFTIKTIPTGTQTVFGQL